MKRRPVVRGLAALVAAPPLMLVANRCGAAAGDALREHALRVLRQADPRPPWLHAANWANRHYGPWVSYLAGTLDESAFLRLCAVESDYCLRDLWNLRGPPAASIDWARMPAVPWAGIHALVLAWAGTGDVRYLHRWSSAVLDFASWTRRRPVGHEHQLEAGQPQALLDAALAWGGILTALGIAARALGQPAVRRFDPWVPSARPWPAADDLLPATWLTRLAQAFAEGDARWLMRHHADPRYVPNQRAFGLEAVAMLAAVFAPLPAAAAYAAALEPALLDLMQRYRCADGGQLEQSFNYARDLVHTARRLQALPWQPRARWRAEARQTVQGWRRFSSALRTPDGGLPQLGNAPWGRVRADGEPPLPLAVRSVALPYSGHYVMRSGWDAAADYLHFFVRRAARGHTQAGSLALQFAAHGRPLIVAGGSADYRPGHAGDAVRDFRSEASSWKCSTLLVDGQSQFSGSLRGLALDAQGRPDPTRSPAQPLAGRWHHDEAFDFTEGLHDAGYGRTAEGGAAIADTRHWRQLVHLRPMGLWLVLDTLHASQSRSFTQVWNLPPRQGLAGVRGFAAADLELQPDGLLTREAGPDAVNLQLVQVGPASLQRRLFTGEGGFGWFGPGPLRDAVPAPNLHVRWQGQGTQVVLTALLPLAPDRPAPRLVAWSVGRDGLQASFEASGGERASLQAMAAAGAQRAPTLALDWTRGGALQGRLALDGRHDHSWLATGGRRQVLAPAGFRWRTAADGRLEPLYDNPGVRPAQR